MATPPDEADVLELVRTTIARKDASGLNELFLKLGPLRCLDLFAQNWKQYGESLLHYGSRKGTSAEVVKVLLPWCDDVKVKAVNGEKATPLLLACRYGNVAICEVLLNNGACVDDVDDMEDTVIHAAVLNPEDGILRCLLEEHNAGYLVNHRNTNGTTALMSVCNTGPRGLSDATLLLDHKANVNMGGLFEGWTPLHMACRYNKPELVKLLLERGADPLAKDTANGEFALTKAAENGLEEVVEVLLNNSTGHNMEALCNGLIMAATQRKTNVVKLILPAVDSRTLNPYLKDCLEAIYDGRVADLERVMEEGGRRITNKVTLTRLLLMAAASGQCKMISLLTRCMDIDIDAQDEAGLTALHMAAYASHSECVQELVGAGADVNARDKCKKSPLLHAAFGSSFADANDCTEVLSTLLKNGAQPNSRSISTAPLHRLSMTGSPEHVRLLCEFGASLTLPNAYGRCPLEVAWRPDLSKTLQDLYSETQNREASIFLASSLPHQNLMKQLSYQWLSRRPETIASLKNLHKKKEKELNRKLLEMTHDESVLKNEKRELRDLQSAIQRLEGKKVLPALPEVQSQPPPASSRTSQGAEAQSTRCYKMASTPRGFAVVFNNWKFTDPSKTRDGYDIDRQNLTKLFKFLQFDEIAFENLSAREMYRKLIKISQKSSLAKHDCFILVMLSHGREGIVQGSDGKPVYIKEIENLFSNKNCKALAGKPKLFFIQACRGSTVDTGVKLDGEEDYTATTDTDERNANYDQHEANIWQKPQTYFDNDKNLSQDSLGETRSEDVCLDAGSQYKPTICDMFLIKPNTEGFSAFRLPMEEGSCLISTIVQVMLERAQNMHLMDMMTEVTQQLAQRDFNRNYQVCKMCPEISSSLTNFLYFFPECITGNISTPKSGSEKSQFPNISYPPKL